MAEATVLSPDDIGLILTNREAEELYTLLYVHVGASVCHDIRDSLAKIKIRQLVDDPFSYHEAYNLIITKYQV